MRSSTAFAVTVAAFLASVLLVLGVMASYGMMNGNWGMQGMHGRMMVGGVDNSGAQVTQGATESAVDIRDYAYAPGNLQVPVGATVTWTNYDSVPHTATAEDGGWDTGILKKGEKATLTFDSPGDYAYYCTVHPSMKARLRVG